jgi:hypothetical protein
MSFNNDEEKALSCKNNRDQNIFPFGLLYKKILISGLSAQKEMFFNKYLIKTL